MHSALHDQKSSINGLGVMIFALTRSCSLGRVEVVVSVGRFDAVVHER